MPGRVYQVKVNHRNIKEGVKLVESNNESTTKNEVIYVVLVFLLLTLSRT